MIMMAVRQKAIKRLWSYENDSPDSASARISKGQGYQGFLRKRAGTEGAVLAKKGQFASYKEKLEKFTEFHYF
jgi:ABC-type tungstate transport system permease subunit